MKVEGGNFVRGIMDRSKAHEGRLTTVLGPCDKHLADSNFQT